MAWGLRQRLWGAIVLTATVALFNAALPL
jgi:hypothetical protein